MDKRYLQNSVRAMISARRGITKFENSIRAECPNCGNVMHTKFHLVDESWEKARYDWLVAQDVYNIHIAMVCDNCGTEQVVTI